MINTPPYHVGQFVRRTSLVNGKSDQTVYEIIYVRESDDLLNGLLNLRAEPTSRDVVVEYSTNVELVNACEGPECTNEARPSNAYCEFHSAGPKFICETPNCANESFYLRSYSSVAHDVDAFGNVDDETKNSLEGDTVSAVKCSTCDNVAVDVRPDDDLNW